jgi:hypothetical protein
MQRLPVSGAKFKQAAPKGIDLSVLGQTSLDAIADSQANHPRTTYAFHLPFEVLAKSLPAHAIRNAQNIDCCVAFHH